MFARKQPILTALAVLALACAAAPHLFADAQSDYDQKWASKGKKATTPSERAKLANELMDAAEETITGKKGKKADSLDKTQDAVKALRGERRDEILLLCQKAYELGSRQRESYGPAARALGIIQILDPDARLDSLVKLQKMYEDCYRAVPSTNVGIAKGLAEVLLQVGDEQLHQWRLGQAKTPSPPAEQIAAIRAVAADYTRGLEVIRSAISAIRPYAAGNKAYEKFLTQAADDEKEILDAQKKLAEPLARITELDRIAKIQQVLQARVAANPQDSAAADHLVRLFLNELDDPKALETVLPHASPAVQSAVALMKKPTSRLTSAEALAVAQWCEKNNDNPASPNRTSMDILTRVYCDAFLKLAKPHDPTAPEIQQIITRLNADLAKAQIGDEQIANLTATYIAALEPPPPPPPPPLPPPPPPPETTVAVAPEPKPEPPPAPDTQPAPPPKETPRQVTSIKVQPPPPSKEDADSDAQRDTRPTIFDFGRD